jgi:hypothetical protein
MIVVVVRLQHLSYSASKSLLSCDRATCAGIRDSRRSPNRTACKHTSFSLASIWWRNSRIDNRLRPRRNRHASTLVSHGSLTLIKFS